MENATSPSFHQRSNVLDVVHAITTVAPQFPEINVWWYIPRLLHDPKIEIVIEADERGKIDFDGVAMALSGHLFNAEVQVRRHRGAEGKLFRVLSRPRQP